MKISVCIPTYKGLAVIKETIDSVRSQTYKNFEIIVSNDSPSDHKELRKILDNYKDVRIRDFYNTKNKGYPLNLRGCVKKAKGEILFLMGQDDLILDKNHFKEIIEIFKSNKNVGIMTRPYYWFEDDINTAIRKIRKSSKRIIGINDSVEDIETILESVGQLSGLIYKKELITEEFNEGVFPAHIYPFLSVFKTHKCYFFKDYTIAVRTSSSQTRFLSSIYNPSPTKTWMEMFNNIFSEKKFERMKKIGINFMGQNYVGLVQIKNYGYYKDLITDIYYLMKYRPKNLINIKFWFYVLGTIFIPRLILRKMVDYYKLKVKNKKTK